MSSMKILIIITVIAVATAILVPIFISRYHSRHVSTERYQEMVTRKENLEIHLTLLKEQKDKYLDTIEALEKQKEDLEKKAHEVEDDYSPTLWEIAHLHESIKNENNKMDTIDKEIAERKEEIETIEEKIRELKALLPSYAGGWGVAPCFACDTLVLMANDSLKRISDVQIGEMVQVYNVESGMVVSKAVVATNSGEADYYYLINGNLKVTPPHPFYTNESKWIEVMDLKVGDKIRSLEGLTQITSIEKVNSGQRICNISVRDFHNFFVSANGVDFYLVQE